MKTQSKDLDNPTQVLPYPGVVCVVHTHGTLWSMNFDPTKAVFLWRKMRYWMSGKLHIYLEKKLKLNWSYTKDMCCLIGNQLDLEKQISMSINLTERRKRFNNLSTQITIDQLKLINNKLSIQNIQD